MTVKEKDKERFTKFWDEYLEKKDDACVDCFTLAFLAYKQGLYDGWTEAIEAHT